MDEKPARDPDAVTIVIATRDRCEDLRQSLPHHEHPVILVDNGSTDSTLAMVRQEFPDVRVIALRENRGAVARNIGVEQASTPYVAFADDDSWWAPGALDVAVDLLERHPRLAVLAGQILVGADHRVDPICQEMAEDRLGTAEDLPGPNVLGFLACGAVVRREAFLSADGFDDVVFFAGEEERLALDLAAAGWGLAYVDKVVAHHHPSPTRRQYARQVRDVRNEILTTLLRRPWTVVAATTFRSVRAGRAGRAGAWEALKRSPRALARRRSLPPRVEVARRLLEERRP